MLVLFAVFCFYLVIRRPPRATRTDTLFPYTTLFRSFGGGRQQDAVGVAARGPFRRPPDRHADSRAFSDPAVRGFRLYRLYRGGRPSRRRRTDRKSTRLNSSHYCASRMPSSA